jgi:hypothetical protein
MPLHRGGRIGRSMPTNKKGRLKQARLTLRWPEPQKSLCPPCSSIASNQDTKAPSNKRTTAGSSRSSSDGSVIKPLRHLARQEGAARCCSGSDASTTRSHVPMMMWWLHSLRLEVAAVQQQLHLLLTPKRVHSHRRVRAPTAAQPRRNEQALPVEHLGKVCPSGDMSRSVPIYVTQYFHTVNRACLPCSPVSIVSRNRSGAAKPPWGLNGLRSSAAISTRRPWVIVSIYGLSSPMCRHVLGLGYLVLYLRLFKAPLFFSPLGFCLTSLWVFAPFFYA